MTEDLQHRLTRQAESLLGMAFRAQARAEGADPDMQRRIQKQAEWLRVKAQELLKTVGVHFEGPAGPPFRVRNTLYAEVGPAVAAALRPQPVTSFDTASNYTHEHHTTTRSGSGDRPPEQQHPEQAPSRQAGEQANA